jgi:chondroitin 4-sulfotransferase 11
VPISHKRRCVFVHIPKTGGTSIEHALKMRGRHRREDRRRLMGPILTDELRARGFQSNFLQHLTAREILRLHAPGALAGYMKFSVVRNPWDRMVSVYHRQDRDMVEQSRAQGVALEGLGFDDFVEASMGVRHAHLRPQHEYLTGAAGGLAVDFVGRFETLGESFQEVCRLLGVRARLPVKYASRRQSRDYRRYYGARSRALVAERYARDIEIFGYAF